MLPQGQQVTPERVLELVESDEDASELEGRPVAVYRRQDGQVYFLGLRDDMPQWKQRGFSCMGPVAFLRKRMETAQTTGVQDDSVAWFLLTDVEREEALGSG